MIDIPFSYLRHLPQDFTDWDIETQQKWLDQFRHQQREKQANYVGRKREEDPDYDEKRRAYARKYYSKNKEKFKEANRRRQERKKEEWLEQTRP